MLSKEEISHIASLAKIELTNDEALLFGEQLSNILNLFKEIDDIKLDNIEETSQITGISNVVFADEVKSEDGRIPSGPKDNLQNTPKIEDTKILTPKVIER
ncbi:MAG: Glutamyl-tRNA(Gln) amidotransferase subunit C [candidate division WS2 bacterium ADurb.Bin280]|uniref:Aspartyl/glutamyl-tRNA(Asn/Gln) amidotransferase subunit C n=1 Tax=candidate division WS2 bacterium ADurb.Bin280 TaxID=1852829 RepID=A0A1V5SDF4_9BACT|nr:MAG: Glutamyl-tRNA(Gln) amidotransferase subunit C [candidate division WS2 bacterium ADurb.Bin280]